MSTEKPVVTRAVVELTFANGVTRRLIIDDKDAVVACNLNVTNDIRETTPDDANWRTYEQGLRRRVDVHLVGRGPLQLDIPPVERCGAISVGDPDVRCDSVAGHPNLSFDIDRYRTRRSGLDTFEVKTNA